MRKLALALLFASFGALSAQANTIVLNINGFNCSTTQLAGVPEGLELQAWSWGTTTQMTGPNGGIVQPQKPTLSLVVANKQTDKCSSALLGLNLKGTVNSTVTITEYINTEGKLSPAMVVTLTSAMLAGYDISGSVGSGNPAESLSFNFQKICLQNNTNKTTACYSLGY
ncbi:MAG: type VI secretion system tube protein Hcp [Terracidiphilus sp.]